ncbi:FeoB-associated Cys-rich membrane protein [Lacinutrix sp.]|nr:FeoB-associated Cys-rich membrane protein [Lacinutrix sp.]
MSTILQNIVVFIILGFAVLFLVKKSFWKKKSKKSCGTDDCGCN